MEARGYIPSRPRTRYKQLKMHGKDVALLLLSVLILVGMIVLSMTDLGFF